MSQIRAARSPMLICTVGIAMATMSCHLPWSHEERPVEWSDTVEDASSACPSISGIYQNVSANHTQCSRFERHCSSLVYALLEEDYDVSHVEIRQEGNEKLEVLAWCSDTLIKHAVLQGEKAEYTYEGSPLNLVMEVSKGKFRCDEDGVHIDYVKHWEFSIAAFDRLRVYGTFNPAEDGSLVMKARDYGYLMMWYFIPWFSWSDIQWARWPPYVKDSNETLGSKWACEAYKKALQGKRYLRVTPSQIKGRAIPELVKLAESGDADAQLQLYWEPEASERLAWLCRAADLGHPEAQYRLGLLYRNGIEGLPQNYKRAYVWYKLAESHGDWSASRETVSLLKLMSSSEILESERLLQEWQPGQCEVNLGLTKQTN